MIAARPAAQQKRKRGRAVRKFISFIYIIIAVLTLSLSPASTVYAASPGVPSLQEPPDSSWWDAFIPDGYSPSEIGQTVLETVWDLLSNSIMQSLNEWFRDTIDQMLAWVSSNWDLSNSGGMLGRALDTMFDSAALMVLPWISLSITVTFFQRMLVAVFPGVVRNFSISQHFGRLFIIIFFVNDYMKEALISFTDITSRMAFSMALGAGSGLVEWDWAVNIMTLIMWGSLEVWQVILALLGVIALFILIVVAIIIKHLIVFFLLAALPIAAASWLYPFTEKFWGKFWWMYLKLLAAPFILAFGLSITLSILGLLGSSPLVGLLLCFIFQGAMTWILFKFLMMPETLMIAAGAGLSAVGAGAVGVPMMVGGGTRLIGRVSGDSRTGQAANLAYKGYQATQGQVDPTAGGTGSAT